VSPALRDVSPFSPCSSSRPLFFSSSLLPSVVPMENVTGGREEGQKGGYGIHLSLFSIFLSSHLHLDNAAIHNSSVVQFGRFSEYVIAPSYTMSPTFPRRSCPFVSFSFSRPLPRRAFPSFCIRWRGDASCRRCIIDITTHRCRPDLNNSSIDRSIDRYVISRCKVAS